MIDLGLCCNLLDRTALAEVKKSYRSLHQVYKAGGVPMPVNTGTEGVWPPRLRSDMHLLRRDSKAPNYDTVRGLFWEGKELYPNSGMKSKNHVQIAVRDKTCIRGYFRPIA